MKSDQTISQAGDLALIRKHLIESTLDCFRMYGYHGSSLSRILEHAGISRHSWLRLYNSKIDLVSDAYMFFLKRSLKRAHALERDISQIPRDIEGVLDSLWRTFTNGRYRDVWVEFNVACRTDLDLFKRLSPSIRSFFNDINRIFDGLISRVASPGITAETVMNMSLYLLRTMSLKSMSLDNPDTNRIIRDRWMAMVKGLVMR